MRKIRLRQIKIITPKGQSLTEKQVRVEVLRAQRLIDAFDATSDPLKAKKEASTS